METMLEKRPRGAAPNGVLSHAKRGKTNSHSMLERVDVAEVYDLIPGAVVVMDTNHTILDLNEAAAQTAGKRKQDCIGAKFWDLFDNPGCRAGTCAASEAVRTGKVCEGEALPIVQGKEMPVLVKAAPRFDDKGRIVGAVELVFPAAGEINLARETGRLAVAAEQGHLSERIDEGKFQDRHLERAKALNSMLDAIIGPLNVAAKYVDEISKGIIPSRITEAYDGDFNTIKSNINACIDGLGGLAEANEVLQRMADNDYTTRVGGSYQGIFADVAKATNKTADTLTASIQQIGQNSNTLASSS